jgi:hypothetical protein
LKFVAEFSHTLNPMHSAKVRITDRASREALAAILRELRYQRRRALELTALCDHGLARIDLVKARAARTP